MFLQGIKSVLLCTESKEVGVEMESPPGKEAVETVEMTTKDRRQDTNLVDKEFERINSNCEESSPVGKMPSKGIGHDRETIHKRKRPSILQTSLLSYFKKLPRPPPPGHNMEAGPSTSKNITTG